MLRSLRVVPVALAFGLVVSSAQADASVQITSRSTSGGVTTVSGTFDLSGLEGPQDVGGDPVIRFDPAGDTPQIATALGIGLTNGLIEPIDGGLRFIWQTDGLPPQVPPEGIRYTWGFAIGTNTYQLQAKVTNLASITTAEAPIEHVQHATKLAGFYQLRGACVTSYEGTPTAGCYHLAFLNGAIDQASGRVSIDLPWMTEDRIGRIVAPDFLPGATIIENLTAGMSITAAGQAVVGNTSTSSYLNGWPPYLTAPQVDLAIGNNPEQADFASYFYPATISGNTFTGTINNTTGAEVVFARACYRSTCLYDAA